MTTARLLATVFLLLLTACSSTRHVVSPQEKELSEFVLVLEAQPDGQVRHDWRPATEFEPARYRQFLDDRHGVGCVVLASRRPRDCDQEQIDCVRDCMKSRLPSSQSHIKRSDGSKYQFCQDKCRDEYMDCLDLQKVHALQFETSDEAIAWLKRNQDKLLIGVIVIIAGVAFVTLSAGTGAALLVPVILMAE